MSDGRGRMEKSERYNDEIMEQWAMELVDAGFPGIPTFHYSNIPVVQNTQRIILNNFKNLKYENYNFSHHYTIIYPG